MGEKWRCWMDQNGRSGWRRDGEPLPREAKWVGVHLFSDRLDSAQNLDSIKFWGGLQLIGQRADSRCLEVFRKRIAQLMFEYAVPMSLIEYYENTHGYEAYIPGRFFRSAGVSAHQLKDDEFFRLRYGFVNVRLSPLGDPECYGNTSWTQNVALEKLFESCPDKVSSAIKIINDIPVYFSIREGLQRRRLSARSFWGNGISLDTGDRYVDGIPLLAAEYGQRKQVTVRDLLLSCPIYNESVASWVALDEKEKETIAWTGRGVGLSKKFHPELQRIIKSLRVDFKNKSGELTYEGFLEGCALQSCSNLVLKCKSGDARGCRSCKVRGQSPKALSAFVPHSAECVLQPEGVFSQQPEPKKISGPIWVHTCFESKDGETLGYELFFISYGGDFESITITAEEFCKPVLYASLIEHGFQLPPSKTLRGFLRRYLDEQEPMRREERVARGGWQADGSFGMLSPSPLATEQEIITICSSSDFLRAQYQWDFVDEEEMEACIGNRTLARFVRAVSYSSALLNAFSLNGYCVHFYGGTEKQRRHVARYASSLWNIDTGGCGYSVENAQKCAGEIKRGYQDQAICVVNTQDSLRKYRSFLKRFLLGRSGYESGARAVIISVGEENLINIEESEREKEVYFQDGIALGICIDLGLFKRAEGANLFYELVSADVFLGKIARIQQDEHEQHEAKGKIQKLFDRKTSKFVLAVWSVIFLAAKNILGRGMIPGREEYFEAVLQIAEKWQRGHLPWWRELSILIGHVENSMWQVRSLRSYDVLVGRKRCLFFPASNYKKALGINQGKLAKFSRWLIDNQILVTDPQGRATRVQYISELQKSVRGYVIDKQKLK